MLFARYCLCFIFAIPSSAEAQEANSYPDYVVIGAFAKHKNAIRFADDANQNNFSAKFEINPNRNLYYVYVLTTPDHALAVGQALKLRTETKYFDTWVYSGPLGEFQPGHTGYQAQDLNPATGEKIDIVRSVDAQTETTSARVNPRGASLKPGHDASVAEPLISAKEQTSLASDPPHTNPAIDKAVETRITPDASAQQKNDSSRSGSDMKADGLANSAESKGTPADGMDLPKRTTEKPLTADEIVGKDFFFSLFRADNHRVIEGEVDAIDFEKSRKMATYDANVPVKVMLPSGKSKQMSFVCQVFGYRKLQKEFDPASPSEELYLDEGGRLVVPFELVRLQKGDIAIMYNVFFFKDAAVMRPESRYEVNNLLELLLENPGYRIRIHGHTNGNATGKIIRMGKPGNFYTLSETNDGFGTAKKLSEERAMIIREYLISSGVSGDRMEVKAWGGKKPLFDKNSVRAVENVRVEVEILSE